MPLGILDFGRQKHRHNPGQYRTALVLRAPNSEHADSGDQQMIWTDGVPHEVRGRWRQTSQREGAMDGGRYSAVTGVWEIPWLPDVTTQFRVEFGTRYYRVVGIHNPEELNRELWLYCVEDEGAKGADE